jgi:hypothetical protein
VRPLGGVNLRPAPTILAREAWQVSYHRLIGELMMGWSLKHARSLSRTSISLAIEHNRPTGEEIISLQSQLHTHGAEYQGIFSPAQTTGIVGLVSTA